MNKAYLLTIFDKRQHNVLFATFELVEEAIKRYNETNKNGHTLEIGEPTFNNVYFIHKKQNSETYGCLSIVDYCDSEVYKLPF